MSNAGYQPDKPLDSSTPPKGGSGVPRLGTLPTCDVCGFALPQDGLKTITCICRTAPAKASSEPNDYQERYEQLLAAVRRFFETIDLSVALARTRAPRYDQQVATDSCDAAERELRRLAS